MAKPDNPIMMAVIGAAHGIRGEVRVKSFTGDPLALGDYGPLYDAAGRAFVVAAVRPATNVVVARFKGVDSREAAEALTGTELFIDRSVLPANLAEEEFYHADLIGLDVRDETGVSSGRIIAIHDFGGGDMLEVQPATGRSVMIPFSAAAVPEVDVRGGFVRVERMAAGLVDPGDGEESPGRQRR